MSKTIYFKDFVGKKHIIESISTGIRVFKKIGKPLDHILFYGPPGVGKTTLSRIISQEMGSNLRIVQGTNIKTTQDIIGILSQIRENDVLLIDEIHSLGPKVAEVLYPVLENNVLDFIIGAGNNKKSIRVTMPKFTLIAATTNISSLRKPLEDRFGYVFYVDPYSREEIREIIVKMIEKWGTAVGEEICQGIVDNSRGIPRNAIRMLRRLQDHLTLNSPVDMGTISGECGLVYRGLNQLEIDYLMALNSTGNGYGSIAAISGQLNLDEKTITSRVEPFLLREGLIMKGNRGRRLSEAGEELIRGYMGNPNSKY